MWVKDSLAVLLPCGQVVYYIHVFQDLWPLVGISLRSSLEALYRNMTKSKARVAIVIIFPAPTIVQIEALSTAGCHD